MTCRETQERLVDLFDAEPRDGATELESHLAACPNCARAYAEIQAAIGLIEPHVRVQASPDFKERVMNKLTQTETTRSRWRFIPRLALVAAAAALILMVLPHGQSPVVSLLAQSAEAMSNLQSVHITARMRTAPQDNFDYINEGMDWVPLEIWKQFGTPPKWRVEKPLRVVAMDGTSSVLFMKTSNQAVRGGPKTGFLGWLNLILDTDQIMDRELASAKAQESSARLAEENSNGVHRLVLTVERTAPGKYVNDWTLNTGVDSSNHTRIYSFDPVSKRLEGMQIVLHAKSGDVAVFEITEIRYNDAIDPGLFAVALPADVIWDVPPEQMPVKRALPQSPKEAAAMFFDALSRQDTEALLTVYAASAAPKWAKELAGVQVVSFGEPFQSGKYPGWFVPYEITLHGQVKKHNLAVRNDNPAHRWLFDGGL